MRMGLGYRWFGNGPDEQMTGLGGRVAKHTKGNAEGIKGVREGIRVVPRGKFAPVASMSALTDRLFGPAGD